MGEKQKFIVESWDPLNVWRLCVEANTEAEAARLYRKRWPNASAPTVHHVDKHDILWHGHGDATKFKVVWELSGKKYKLVREE